MLRRSLLVASAAAVLASCTSTPAPLPPPGPRTLLFPRSGALPAISMSAAIPVSVADMPAVDMLMRSISGAGFRAQVSYGLSGGRQSCDTLPSCTLRSASISGRRATYVRYPLSQTIEGVGYSTRLVGYVPVAQLRRDEPESGLLLNGWCTDERSCEMLQRLFLSIRIEASAHNEA